MENEEVLTPEQKAEEEAALVVLKDEDLKAKVIEDYGFDKTADADKIEKAMAKEKKSREITSKAIQQKIKYRTEAETLRGGATKKPEAKSDEGDKGGNSDLSSMDMYTLMQNEVHQEDISEVSDFAKLKKISIADALKSPIVKNILAEKAEFRKSADAAASGTTRRSTAKVTDEQLGKDLSEGKIPEKGSEEANRLFWARRGGKR